MLLTHTDYQAPHDAPSFHSAVVAAFSVCVAAATAFTFAGAFVQMFGM